MIAVIFSLWNYQHGKCVSVYCLFSKLGNFIAIISQIFNILFSWGGRMKHFWKGQEIENCKGCFIKGSNKTLWEIKAFSFTVFSERKIIDCADHLPVKHITKKKNDEKPLIPTFQTSSPNFLFIPPFPPFQSNLFPSPSYEFPLCHRH